MLCSGCFTVVLICRISSIIVDLLVVIVTWKKTFWHWKDATRLFTSPSISACLLRDGRCFDQIPCASLNDAVCYRDSLLSVCLCAIALFFWVLIMRYRALLLLNVAQILTFHPVSLLPHYVHNRATDTSTRHSLFFRLLSLQWYASRHNSTFCR